MKGNFTDVVEAILKIFEKHFVAFSVVMLLLGLGSALFDLVNVIAYVIVTIVVCAYSVYAVSTQKGLRLLLVFHLTLLLLAGIITFDELFTFYLCGFLSLIIYLESKLQIKNSSKDHVAEFRNKTPSMVIKLEGDNEITCDVKSLKADDLVRIPSNTLIPVEGLIKSGSSVVSDMSLRSQTDMNLTVGNKVYVGNYNKTSDLQVKITESRELWVNSKVELELVSGKEIATYIDHFDKLYLKGVIIYLFVSILVLEYLLLAQNVISLSSLWYLLTAFPIGLYFVFIFSLDHYKVALENIGIKINSFYGFLKLSTTNILCFGDTLLLQKPSLRVIEFRVFDTKLEQYAPNLVKKIVYSVISKSKSENLLPLLSYLAEIVKNTSDDLTLTNFQETENSGIKCTINKFNVLIGNYKFCEKEHIFESLKVREFTDEIASYSGEAIYVAINKEIVGVCALAKIDIEKSETEINELITNGMNVYQMTSGNYVSQNAKVKTFKEFNIDKKLEKLEFIKKETEKDRIVATDSFTDIPLLLDAEATICTSKSDEIVQKISDVVLEKPDMEHLIYALDLSYSIRSALIRNIWINLTAYPLVVFICVVLKLPMVIPLIFSLLTIISAYFLSYSTSKYIKSFS